MTAGLATRRNSGPVEGQYLKGQGYGRASSSLLRRRILLTP
ncbi:hypothetical protein ACFV2N_28225 [Streptomyces sp. NPDC059680]